MVKLLLQAGGPMGAVAIDLGTALINIIRYSPSCTGTWVVMAMVVPVLRIQARTPALGVVTFIIGPYCTGPKAVPV